MLPFSAAHHRGRAYVAAATIAGTIHVFGGSDGQQAWIMDDPFGIPRSSMVLVLYTYIETPSMTQFCRDSYTSTMDDLGSLPIIDHR